MAIKTNIIRGDTVLVRRGKEKGKRGTVKAVNRMLGTATVEGINIVKRHTKQGSTQGAMASQQTGGIIEKESPLPLSVLQYVCEKCKAPTRVRRTRTADGKVHRVCARCGEPARESAKGA
ncbi:MAG TPA: 50S ribosomal protein L24 [Candidatus Baltobacteraceae bacterium]|jgi:large subunit ribosomal protein L24|nr:50S ribosomal protein L24 [Candidatus Baltobacteraceae bacterium]